MQLDKKSIIGIAVVGLVFVAVIIATVSGGPWKPKEEAYPAPSSTAILEDEEDDEDLPPGLPDNISEVGEGVNSVSNVEETVDYFRSQKGKLTLGGSLRYPDSTIAASSTAVTLGDKFKINVTKNWIINLDGNTINAVHTTGPSCTIMQTKLADKYFTDVVDQQLSTFLADNGIEQGTVTDIFYNDKVVGRMASSSFLIEGEDYILDAGIFLLDKEVYQLVCVYPPETEETVTSFYNSVMYGTKAVVLK